jgi:hypothetical protein
MTMKSLALGALAVLASAGCAIPVTGVVRLGDGVLRAATPLEAETFCRIDGNPIRFEEQPAGAKGVLFRCD